MSTPLSKYLFVALAILLSLVGFSAALSAAADQKNGDVTSAVQEMRSLEERSEELLEKIAGLQQQARANRSELKKAEGESRSAIILQLLAKEQEMRTLLDELVSLIQEQEQSGQGTGSQVTQAKKFISDQTAVIQQDIETVGRSLAALNRIDRTAMSVEEADELTQQIAVVNKFLDGLYTAAFEYIQRKNTLKMDASADRDALTVSLRKRAKLLAGHVELTWRQIQSIENRISRQPADGGGSGAEKLQSDLYLLEEKREGITQSLGVTVGLMDQVGLDSSKYRLLLVQVTGNISDHIFNSQVMWGLAGKLYDSSLDWIADHGPSILVKIIVVLLILLVFKIIASLAGRLVRKAILKSHLSLSTLLQDFFVSMASKAVMLIGLLIVLSQFGVEIGPALAGLGVVGFIVGFALQETLSNFASGLMILVYRPFDVGDLVEVAGITGRVRLMSLVSTTIVTLDNQRLVVPNTKIWGDVIRNVTAEKNRRIDMVFGIGYDDDIGHAEQILTDIIESHELVLEKPEADIKLHTLGESSVDFVVRPWVRTDDYWTVYWDITRAVKNRFDSEGISIPYPQRDVHMYQLPANPPPVEPAGGIR